MSPRTAQTTAGDVAAAEQEAAEAEQLAAALEERVREGDDSVTPDQIASARELGRFARLRTEATRRKAERAKAAARLAACESLRDEIETYAEGSGARFAELLTAADNAVRAFVAALDERNDHLTAWRQTMVDLGVPAHDNPLIPDKGHGNLGHVGHSGQIIARTRRMAPTTPDEWLSRMLTAVVSDRGNGLQRLTVPISSPVDNTVAFARLAAIDAPRDAPDASAMHFYRGPGGAVVERDQPYSAEDIARLGLTPISRKEAWGK